MNNLVSLKAPEQSVKTTGTLVSQLLNILEQLPCFISLGLQILCDAWGQGKERQYGKFVCVILHGTIINFVGSKLHYS